MPQVRAFLRERSAGAAALRRRARAHRAGPGHRLRQDGGAEFRACWRASANCCATGYPLLAGWSRKSSLGAVTGHRRCSERMVPSVAAAVLAVERGARIVRVHDVRETVAALKVWRAMQCRPTTSGRRQTT